VFASLIERIALALDTAALPRFETADDLVIHKILAGRARDLDDARAILLKNPNIDAAEVRRVLQEFQESLERGTEPTDRFDAIWDDIKPG
jgi:hypothetical protein